MEWGVIRCGADQRVRFAVDGDLVLGVVLRAFHEVLAAVQVRGELGAKRFRIEDEDEGRGRFPEAIRYLVSLHHF